LGSPFSNGSPFSSGPRGCELRTRCPDHRFRRPYAATGNRGESGKAQADSSLVHVGLPLKYVAAGEEFPFFGPAPAEQGGVLVKNDVIRQEAREHMREQGRLWQDASCAKVLPESAAGSNVKPVHQRLKRVRSGEPKSQGPSSGGLSFARSPSAQLAPATTLVARRTGRCFLDQRRPLPLRHIRRPNNEVMFRVVVTPAAWSRRVPPPPQQCQAA
jgi:hypothetical protein